MNTSICGKSKVHEYRFGLRGRESVNSRLDVEEVVSTCTQATTSPSLQILLLVPSSPYQDLISSHLFVLAGCQDPVRLSRVAYLAGENRPLRQLNLHGWLPKKTRCMKCERGE